MPDQITSPERRLIISRQTHRGQYFTESLNDRTNLDMMLIPSGTFMMGQTAAEKVELINQVGEEDYQKYYASELPRHSVTVPSFFMGRYPITQAQWLSVAAYPAVERELKLDPSEFKGVGAASPMENRRPVEQVSWDDATEFCRRLSQHTNRTYRLPSEAEWEYACRAGTTPSFHFGETLDADLANYSAEDWEVQGKLYQGTYGRGVQGKYRKETTDVGIFPANLFGLYDMHGNVLEWCEDDFHASYEGAPIDGRTWVDSDRTEARKLLRGGSWFNVPRECRSAVRYYRKRDIIDGDVGFRVCCVLPRVPS
jgi:formylglycine-generating enzyme required for sulfatase activity